MSLKPYRRKRSPLRFAVYDLEWYPETINPEHELFGRGTRLVGMRDEKGHRSYPSVVAFLAAELVRANAGKVFFAHAGGLADIQFVLEAFIKRGNPDFRIQGSWSGSSLIICRITAGKNSWTFADSFWLFRDSLDKIGKSIGLAKGGEDYQCPDFPACGHDSQDHRRRTCIFYAPDAELHVYNERDCEILYRAIDRFQDEILELGGKMRMTIAANAMMLFRAKHLRQTIPTSRALNRMAREAYIASRVEVFQRHCGRSNYYDVNSSFPHSMTFPLPGHYLGSSNRYHEGELALIDATVRNPDGYLPSLPIRLDEFRIYFPTGRFRRLMTSEDFSFLLETGGAVEQIHEVHRFESFTDLAEYVDVIYTLRKDTDDSFRKLVYKYLLNALYGKLGEDEFKAELLINPPKRPTCTGGDKCRKKCSCIEVYAPGVYRVDRQVEVKHAHVPIPAFVTSRSRSTLARDVLIPGHVGGGIAYTDTDSGVTPTRLAVSTELGALKLEDEISAGTFLSAKLYKITSAQTGETKVRSKGFRKLTVPEFDGLAAGDPVTIRRMVRIQENFAAGRFEPREDSFTKYALSHLTPEELRRVTAGWKHKPQPMRAKRCMLPSGDSRPWDMAELLLDSANPD